MSTNFNISLTKSCIEDLIWMSYRYCIGRHTGAAHSHAENIHSIFVNNPDIFSSERMNFFAIDIRRSINWIVELKPNVVIDGCSDFDALSTLLYSVTSDKPSHQYQYIVQSYGDHNVDVEPINKELDSWESFENDYYDLLPWIKLANYLDCSTHKNIITEHNSQKECHHCFPYPLKCNDAYKLVWGELEHDLTRTIYISPEHIVEIRDI